MSTTNPPDGFRRLGDFELVREVGHGGMGVVYEARQVSLNRTVALKVLSGGLGLTAKAVQRFRREAEAAAKLHHTNIVPVYATGEHDGTHFYAMELIDGPSLAVVIRQNRGSAAEANTELPADLGATTPHISSEPTPLSTSSATDSSSSHYFDRAAAMIADVADALHYAHQNNVTHRDIKPSNLLVSSDGRLSVTDFGLARMLEQPGMTITGEFMGTPAYMSPEQIAAGRVPLDHRTDIYSLGATLYELLTLRPPFQADGRDKLLAMVTQKEPASPRSVNAKVPRDLETICMKCLEKDPDRRYQNAKGLAEDLRRYVNRFAILAKRAGPVSRLKKWVARNPAIVGGAVAVLLALAVAGFFAWQAKQESDQRKIEQQQAKQDRDRLAAEQAVDKAILEAMSGDATAALEAIADAANKGADSGRLDMLRGIVEIQRGRPKLALVSLAQALRKLPDSVAVKALQAKAFLDDGQFQAFDEVYLLLERSDPQTPEDHLFLGLLQAEPGWDPVAALRTLEKMPSRAGHSPVARLARAAAQTSYAQLTGDAKDAERALEDLRHVGLPDSHPLLLTTRVSACMTTAHAYDRIDLRRDDLRRDEVLKQAAQDIERMAGYRENPVVALARCQYYHFREMDDLLLDTIQKAIKDRAHTPLMTSFEVDVHYRRDAFEKALKAIGESSPEADNPWWSAQKAIVLAAIPGRKDDALQAFEEANRLAKGGTGGPALIPGYVQLLGPKFVETSQEYAIKNRKRALLMPKIHNGWYNHMLDFHAGSRTETELIKIADKNKFNLCEAHFYIGLRRLAKGDRDEAKKCFRLAAETAVFTFWEYMWGRAFLDRMEKNPSWPPWISPEKNEAKAK